MFEADPRTGKIVAAALRRVLILDPNPNATRLLADQMRALGQVQIQGAATVGEGMALARSLRPDIVFVEHASAGLDGLAFTQKLRRGHLECREAAVVMCTAETTHAAIFGARDAGVHEFLRKPFTLGDLERRLAAVTLKPRPWIEAVGYVGPDRRRFNSAEYKGPTKRRSDSKGDEAAARLSQALRIVRSAAQHLDTDPAQARRALAAQAQDLAQIAVATGDTRLAQAAAALTLSVGAKETLDRQALTRAIDDLIGLAPAAALAA